MLMVAQAFAPHLLCEISEHVGDLLDLFVVACSPACQRLMNFQCVVYLTSTRGVALSGVLVAVHL